MGQHGDRHVSAARVNRADHRGSDLVAAVLPAQAASGLRIRHLDEALQMLLANNHLSLYSHKLQNISSLLLQVLRQLIFLRDY